MTGRARVNRVRDYTEWRKQEPQSSQLDAKALALIMPPWGATFPTAIHSVIWKWPNA